MSGNCSRKIRMGGGVLVMQGRWRARMEGMLKFRGRIVIGGRILTRVRFHLLSC